MSAPAPPAPPWAQAAMRRASFPTLIRVEFRKLTGTLSDRILLVAGPLALLGFCFLPVFTVGSAVTAKQQVAPLTVALRIAPVVLQAILIKLIAGEWHYRSAQPTLLAQPSRRRYLAAQLVVAQPFWLLCGLTQFGIYFWIASSVLPPQDAVFLMGYRVGWVFTICMLGAFLMTFAALTVSMLVQNGPGALAGFLVAMPAFALASGLAPAVVTWIDPLTPMLALADVFDDAVAPAITSAVLWVGLFVFALRGHLRRDAA